MSVSILLFFAVMFFLVYIMRVAKIGALVAFLVAGVLSGPYVLNLFELNSTWTFLGDLGILFLWFNIGLEINMARLWRLRRTIFGFGAAQVLMVIVMFFPLLFSFTNWPVLGCIMVAMLLAMSSTSADLQLLTDRNQINTDVGSQTFSILLFQDLLAIPLLAMLPVLAGKTFNFGAAAIDVTVISVALILFVMVLGRFVMTPLFRMVAKIKSKEAFLLTVMLNIVIWAILMDLMGLPAGLGAFMAGMLMSETIYRHEITAGIAPYSTLFLALFFVYLGMNLNIPVLLEHWDMVLLGLVALVVLKFFAIYLVARIRGLNTSDSTFIALLLAQGGEFALLMLQTMKSSGIEAIPVPHKEILTAVIILSIMLTPLLLCLYDYIHHSGKFFPKRVARIVNDLDKDVKDVDVIVCGFGRVGQIICQMLDAQKISYVAIDLDVDSVMLGREQGFNVVYGDATNRSVLYEFGLRPRKTRAVVVVMDNATTARKSIAMIKSIAPRVAIFARARTLADSRILLQDKINAATPETIESSFLLGSSVLEHLGVSERKIDALLDDMRADNYVALSAAVEKNK